MPISFPHAALGHRFMVASFANGDRILLIFIEGRFGDDELKVFLQACGLFRIANAKSYFGGAVTVKSKAFTIYETAIPPILDFCNAAFGDWKCTDAYTFYLIWHIIESVTGGNKDEAKGSDPHDSSESVAATAAVHADSGGSVPASTDAALAEAAVDATPPFA